MERSRIMAKALVVTQDPRKDSIRLKCKNDDEGLAVTVTTMHSMGFLAGEQGCWVCVYLKKQAVMNLIAFLTEHLDEVSKEDEND